MPNPFNTLKNMKITRFQVISLNKRAVVDKGFDNFLQFRCQFSAKFTLFGMMYVEEMTEVLGFNTVQAAGVVPNFSGQILGILFFDHRQFE